MKDFTAIVASPVFGFVLGVLSSLACWYLVSHLLRPNVRFSGYISETFLRQSGERIRHRIKMKNVGSRDIIDIKVLARVRIRGLRLERPNNISYLDLFEIWVPYMQRKGSRVLDICETSQLRFKDDPRLAFAYQEWQERDPTMSLTSLLDMRQEANLEVLVFGYDSFSGARRMFRQSYNRNSFRRGSFFEGGLEIVFDED